MIIYIRYSNAPPLIVMKLLYILRAQETVCHPKIINNRRFSQSKIHYKHYNTTTVAIHTVLWKNRGSSGTINSCMTEPRPV